MRSYASRRIGKLDRNSRHLQMSGYRMFHFHYHLACGNLRIVQDSFDIVDGSARDTGLFKQSYPFVNCSFNDNAVHDFVEFVEVFGSVSVTSETLVGQQFRFSQNIAELNP